MKGGEITDNPLISVITVVFNGAKNIEGTIASVLNQTYKNVEYIIIDGGSTDGTVEIIKKYNSKIKHWISERDNGIYDAMNKAIDLASGEWINFMNCGDRFIADDVLSLFTKKYDADILYGDAIVEYVNFTTPFKIHPIHSIWKYSPFCHQASFIKTSLIKNYRYDLMYKIGADHDLFFRAYKANKKFYNLNTVICLFDGREGTTKKRIVQAIQDKKNIALKYEYSIWKWVYFQCYLMYIHLVLVTKRVFGNHMTEIVTRILKKNQKI